MQAIEGFKKDIADLSSRLKIMEDKVCAPYAFNFF